MCALCKCGRICAFLTFGRQTEWFSRGPQSRLRVGLTSPLSGEWFPEALVGGRLPVPCARSIGRQTPMYRPHALLAPHLFPGGARRARSVFDPATTRWPIGIGCCRSCCSMGGRRYIVAAAEAYCEADMGGSPKSHKAGASWKHAAGKATRAASGGRSALSSVDGGDPRTSVETRKPVNAALRARMAAARADIKSQS